MGEPWGKRREYKSSDNCMENHRNPSVPAGQGFRSLTFPCLFLFLFGCHIHVCVRMWRPEDDIRHHVLPFSHEKGSLAEPGVRLVTSSSIDSLVSSALSSAGVTEGCCHVQCLTWARETQDRVLSKCTVKGSYPVSLLPTLKH